MKGFIIKTLHKIRYLTLLPAVMFIGFITMPFTLLFKWNGYFILAVAHYEWCSLVKAKRLLLENKDGKYTLYCGYKEKNYNRSCASLNEDQLDILNNHDTEISSFSRDLYYSPSYSYYPSNTCYSPHND
jgi:hypothetical protein